MTDPKNPAISVVVPVYNQQDYVGACVASILAQTMTDAELLLVDDGSTDDSLAVMRRVAADVPRCTVIEQPNRGVAAARNAGLDAARGAWVCFIDPDDVVDDDYLATLFAQTDEHPQADVIMSTCVAFDDAGERRQHFFPEDFTVRGDEAKRPLYHQLMDGAYRQQSGFVTAIGVPWGKLYRRALLDDDGLRFDPRLPRMQDNLFNMEVFHAARELVYIDYAGYRYRVGGLGARTLANTAKGLYHPAIDARSRLMREYRLDADNELRLAWYIEQVNLYYQELKAVAMLQPRSWSRIRKACLRRARELRGRLDMIDPAVLPMPIRLKYLMLTNRLMNAVAATLLWKSHER